MFPSSPLSRKLDGDQFDILVNTWAVGLEGFNRQDAERGIARLVRSGDTFPPSLPEFRSLCKGSNVPYHKPYAGLSAPIENHGPASIDHDPKRVRKELKRLQLTPKPGETQHQYAMRCRDYLMANHSNYGRLIGNKQKAAAGR